MLAKVDFEATTKAVLGDFYPEFTEVITNLIEQRNTEMSAPGSKARDTYTDVRNGYGLLVLAHDCDGEEPFTITTEFLVPANDLAASFMVMWRRWCAKRGLHSHDALLMLMNTIITTAKEHAAERDGCVNSNYSIGLMGAVLDNYPEIVASMQWSVDNGYAPCLVVTNESNVAKCGVCYGGKYMTPEIEADLYRT